MTRLPSPETAPLLLTDADVLERVTLLVGPAVVDRRLWLLFTDGDRRQCRVVCPVDEMPPLPDVSVADLGAVLDMVLPTLATAAGPGAVIFVRERRGPDRVLRDDRVWDEVLHTMCRARGIALRGVYLSTPGGVRPLR